VAELPTKVVPGVDLPFEFMINALRLPAGFETELFEARTGEPFASVAGTLAQLEARGLVQSDARSWRASARGLRYLNDLLTEFLPTRASDGLRAAPRVT
jgi:oxygen-independent coproporphyrinogen-3 oxidase